MDGRPAIDIRTPTTIDANEQRTRLDVAMAYRLIHHFGFDDLTDGFVSARWERGGDDIVVGGYGALPELVRASELHRRRLSDPVVLEKHGGVDVDALRFTKTVFEARPDAMACIHAHPFYTMLFSCLDADVLPMSQYGFMYRGKVGYVPFCESDVTGGEARRMILAALDGNEAVVLRNHGILVFGQSVPHAFWVLYRLEQTFRLQIEAMRTGQKIIIPPENEVASIQAGYWNETYVENDGNREWPSYVRLLDRKDPSWRD